MRGSGLIIILIVLFSIVGLLFATFLIYNVKYFDEKPQFYCGVIGPAYQAEIIPIQFEHAANILENNCYSCHRINEYLVGPPLSLSNADSLKWTKENYLKLMQGESYNYKQGDSIITIEHGIAFGFLVEEDVEQLLDFLKNFPRQN